MPGTSKKADDVPSIPAVIWEFMRRRFGRAAAPLFLAGLAAIGVGTFLYNSFDSWKGLVLPSPPPLEVASVSSSAPGMLKAVLRNRSMYPLVINSIALEVKEAREFAFGQGQGSSIPVLAAFDVVLSPQPRLMVRTFLAPVQILANTAEQVEVSVGSRASKPPARIEYSLVLHVTYDGQATVSSAPVRMQVFVLPQL